MTKLVLVQGTHAWGRGTPNQWWEAESALCRFLVSEGFACIGHGGCERPFIWDTDLDGIGWIKGKGERHVNWKSSGMHFYNYLRPALLAGEQVDAYVPVADRNVVAHSHGAQVVAYACAAGLKINRLLTIGSPVRKDMEDVYCCARPYIGRWLHVHSDSTDRIQWFGEVFDGHFGIIREQPFADENKLIRNVAHSKLLNDAGAFPLWQSEGLCAFLRGEAWP